MIATSFSGLAREAGSAAIRRAAPPLLSPLHAPRLLPSSPHVVGMAAFRAAFGGTTARAALIDALEARLAEVASAGARVECVLVGGSFVDPTREPNDVDGLVVYSVGMGRIFDERLAVALDRSCEGLDLRFVASDADPILLVKMIAFFTTLYTGFEKEGCLRRAAVLLSMDGSTPRSER